MGASSRPTFAICSRRARRGHRCAWTSSASEPPSIPMPVFAWSRCASRSSRWPRARRGNKFLNLVTREEIEYHGAAVFCLRLPEGRYSLYGIGERSGPMGSESPFTFEIKRGERRYIGTIVKPWRTSAIDRRSIVSVREYRYDHRLFASGGSPNVLFGPSYELVVLNRPDDVMDRYGKDCPGLRAQEIQIAPMR
jgi:hypothetical protein